MVIALVRLVDDAVDLVQEHLRARHLELEALAAHLLDEDGQLELAAAAHLERVGRRGGVDLDADVAEDLALEAGPDLARGEELARRCPASGDVLTPKVMRSVGSSTERRGSGRGSAGSVIVSPMVTSGSPATATMSPGPASAISTRLDAVRRRQGGHAAGQRDDAARLDAAVRRFRLLAQRR